MARITLLLFVSLMLCLSMLQLSEAIWVDIEGANPNQKGVLKQWVDVLQDDADIQETFQFYTVQLRMRPTRPGIHHCSVGDKYLLTSDNHPGNYPENSRKRWIFKTDSEAYVSITCPKIRIKPSDRCKKDKLVVFAGEKFRKGVRRCGRINGFSTTTEDNLKVSFKSNGDSFSSQGFLCRVSCLAIPTTSTTPPSTTTTIPPSTTTTTSTTTTFSPDCPRPAFPPNAPISVATCIDLDPLYASSCNCTEECSGKISLTCDFCTRCDFDIFAVHDFSVDVVLEPHYPCQTAIDVSGYFFHNSDRVTALRVCLDESWNHITFPFSELTNLNTLIYQDCNNTLVDPCLGSRSLSPKKRRAQNPSTRIAYPVSVPSESNIPNVVNLYLYDVDLTLTSGTISLPNLEVLHISSDAVEVQDNAFTGFVGLKDLYVEMCQTTLVDNAFKLDASSLESFEIYDTCAHTIGNNAIVFEGLSRRKLTRTATGIISVYVTASASFFDFIPMCPFRPLLEFNCVNLVWHTEIRCRSCGGIWYWELTSEEANNITSTCYDSVSSTSMSLTTYMDGHGKPCPYSSGYITC